MDSDTPDLAALQALCHEFKATLVVDVAHDLGCLGDDGRGHIGIQNMLGKIDIVMGSFSKTFGSNGGFVACNSRAVKEYLRSTVRPRHSRMRCRRSRRQPFSRHSTSSSPSKAACCAWH